jgi:transposase-like protein
MPMSFQGVHFPQDILRMWVRWYGAYPVSYRHVEARRQERGVSVDHATINRWVLTYSPPLAEAFHRRKRPFGRSWRMDEPYIRVTGEWRSLSRAVDKSGQTIDVLLTEPRDTEAARRFLTQALHRHGVPDQSTIDGSEANAAASKRSTEAHGTAIIIRQITSLNTMVAQDQRAVKRSIRPLLGVKSCAAAQATLVGIERLHMLKKNQQVVEEGVEGLTPAEQFYALAA